MELSEKTIAITGSTGGLGRETCLKLAGIGADFVLIDRNQNKSEAMGKEIKTISPNSEVKHISCDLENASSVANATEQLKNFDVDVLILNSGIFNVPIKKLENGLNNIFQVNFLSQYYMARALIESGSVKKVVVVGSIAYKKGKLNVGDIDFSNSKSSTKVYGNSKKFLMFSLVDYCEKSGVKISVVHPGITLTKLTGHYPKFINWLVKLGMKMLFPSTKKACRSVVYGVTNDCKKGEWIGPKIFDIWGGPKKKKLKGLKECSIVGEIADKLYKEMTQKEEIC